MGNAEEAMLGLEDDSLTLEEENLIRAGVNSKYELGEI